MVLVLVSSEWFFEKLGIMSLCLISEPFLKYNFLLCSELQEGCKKFTIRNPRHVQRKWWENLEISWVGMVAIFILLQGLASYVGNFQAIYFGWEYRWCHWSCGENGDLRAFMCYGDQMLQMSSPVLFSIQLAKGGTCWKWGLVSQSLRCFYKWTTTFTPSWLLRGDQEWYDPLKSSIFVL
jgi:hypothetical protein